MEIKDLVKKIKNPKARFNDGDKTTSIYYSEDGNFYYLICSKEHFKECTFLCTVDNINYTESLSRDEFQKIKEYIKK